MEDLKEQASKYVEEKMFDILKEAFAKVYADGYRSGYKDREEEIPVDVRGNNIEYVDLGLPSGTLWANDYVRLNDEIRCFSYDKASVLNIPTTEQWCELTSKCHWEFKGNWDKKQRRLICTGPNGNSIDFFITDIPSDEESLDSSTPIHFWFNNTVNDTSHNILFLDYDVMKEKLRRELVESVEGSKYPIRLVHKKGIY